jgi:hypothetical protein
MTTFCIDTQYPENAKNRQIAMDGGVPSMWVNQNMNMDKWEAQEGSQRQLYRLLSRLELVLKQMGVGRDGGPAVRLLKTHQAASPRLGLAGVIANTISSRTVPLDISYCVRPEVGLPSGCTRWNSDIPCPRHPHIYLNRTATGKNRTRPWVALNAASNMNVIYCTVW